MEFSKKTSYIIMAALMFLASGTITIMYTLSSVMGVIPSTVAFIQGVGIESAKSFFSYHFVVTKTYRVKEGNKTKTYGLGKKGVFLILALLAFAISIVATTGFTINMTNKVKNYITKKSDSYKNSQKFVDMQGDLYGETKKAISDLQTQRDAQIKEMTATKNQLPKDHRTAKAIEQGKINDVTADYNRQIKEKEDKLSGLSNNIGQTTSSTSIKVDEGYEALYTTLAKFINEAKEEDTGTKSTTADDVSFWTSFIISICLELFGIGFIYLSEHAELEEQSENTKTHSKTQLNNSQSGIGFKPQTATSTRQEYYEYEDAYEPKAILEPPRKIGFNTSMKVENQSLSKLDSDATPLKQELNMISSESQSQSKFYGFKREDILRYMDFMFENMKGEDKSPGVKKIWENVGNGSSLEDFRKIHGHLETLGIVITENNSTTRVLCAKSEALSRI